MLLLLLACTTETVAERRTAALRAAAADEPGAGEQCGTLRTAEARGDCLVTWVEASPARAEAGTTCATVEHDEWRAECWFVAAEARMRAGRATEAIAACRDATGFVADCAGHLFHEATLLGPERAAPLVAEVQAAFPEVHAPDTVVERRMFRTSELRAQDRVTLAPCASATNEEGRAKCVRDAATVLRERWERRAEKGADVARVLCDAAARGALPDVADLGGGGRLLAWEASPALDAAVRDAQARACGSEAPTSGVPARGAPAGG